MHRGLSLVMHWPQGKQAGRRALSFGVDCGLALHRITPSVEPIGLLLAQPSPGLPLRGVQSFSYPRCEVFPSEQFGVVLFAVDVPFTDGGGDVLPGLLLLLEARSYCLCCFS